MPLRLGPPGSMDSVLLRALVDTGADCSVVPRNVAAALRLPAVDEIWIEGMTSQARRAWVHAAHVQFAGVDRLARVVAFGAETILGRDLLNITVTRLHGPRLTLSFLQRKQAGIRSSER